MIESMSNTPGVTEATPAPTEAVANTKVPGSTETGVGNNASLGATIENTMAQSPDNSVDTGYASLAGITPGEIGPAAIQAEPAINDPEPIVDITTSETTNTPSQDAPLFSYVSDAQAALADADAKGVSFEDRQKLEIELQQSNKKEGLLMSGVWLIEVDREIAEAKKNGDSKERLAELMAKRNDIVTAREDAYTETIEGIKTYAKRNKGHTGKSFEDVMNAGILGEAKEIKDHLQWSLKDAEKSGITKDIEDAKLRLQAAEMHIGMIKKKKGRGILALIGTLILAAGVTAISDGAKVTKGELTPQKGH